MNQHLWKQVETSLSHLEELRRSDLPDYELSSLLLAELTAALQELQATTAEVMEQNEELATSRQAIEDERSRYLELFEFAPGGYLVTDTQGIILEANSAATSLLCVKKDLLVGKPLALFVHSHERSSFRTRLAQLHKEPEPKNINWEFQLQASNQQAFPAAITVGKMTSQRRKTSELRWLIRDITKRKQLEEELQKADKLESLGILAGGIAHDFNNFLTIILGNLSLAKMYAKGDIKVSKHLHEMEDAFAQTRNLTEQLLTFAKGGEPLTRAVSIDSFIRDVSSFALSGSNTLYEFFLTADLPAVEIDEGQITQVISNLLINADQAMPTGGTIKISAESLVIQGENTLPLQPGHYVAVTIADEGKGIAKKALPKIFDPFFTTKEQGSGLGLTICYSIIKRHGGHIAVKSVEGQGTSFTVYLPASRNDAREEAIDDTLCLGEGKILFMDDEERVRQTAGEMLSALGYEVEFANDGAEAVKKYQDAFFTDSPYDVVITDITVRGGMGGQLAVRELLKIDPHVKAIVSSGYSNDALLSAYKKHGFCGMVAKPYRLQELGEALARVIESKKQNNE